MPVIDTAFSRRHLLKLAVLLPAFPYARIAQSDSGVTGYAKMKQVSGGGVGGEIVYVNNVKALAFHLGGPAHKNIIITCTLKAPDKYTILLGSNKTLIGQLPGITLYNIYLVSSHNQGNVIIKNMTFLHDKKINGNNDIQLRISSGEATGWIIVTSWGMSGLLMMVRKISISILVRTPILLPFPTVFLPITDTVVSSVIRLMVTVDLKASPESLSAIITTTTFMFAPRIISLWRV